MEAGYAYRANSLDGPRVGGDDEDGATLGDTLGGADDGFARAEDRVLIADLLRSLPVRERQVLRMRFDHGFTQAEIGERIGVSQMQVSRILRSDAGAPAHARHRRRVPAAGPLSVRRARAPSARGLSDGRPSRARSGPGVVGQALGQERVDLGAGRGRPRTLQYR